MIDETVNEDIEKTSKCVESPEKAVEAVKAYKTLWLPYQQGQLFEKLNKSFINMVKKFVFSKSTILFKISIEKSVNK